MTNKCVLTIFFDRNRCIDWRVTGQWNIQP